jgi:hypothetical protein
MRAQAGRLIRSECVIAAAGGRLLEELLPSIFDLKHGHGGPELGTADAGPSGCAQRRASEPHFEVAKRLRHEIESLQRRIEVLEGRYGLTSEAQLAKTRVLECRMVSRSMGDVICGWRARVDREHGWRTLRAAVERRWALSGAPRAVYKWVAYVESSKRRHWQQVAEMAQWEAKYSRPGGTAPGAAD